MSSRQRVLLGMILCLPLSGHAANPKTDSPDPSWGEKITISYGAEGAFYMTGTVTGTVDVHF